MHRGGRVQRKGTGRRNAKGWDDGKGDPKGDGKKGEGKGRNGRQRARKGKSRASAKGKDNG